MFPDMNEVQAYIRACQSPDAVRQIVHLAQARLQDLEAALGGQAPEAVKTAVMTPRGEAAPVERKWVQPTDEGHPLGQTAPMAGPAIEALTGQIGPSMGVRAPASSEQEVRRMQQEQRRQGAAQAAPAVGQAEDAEDLHRRVLKAQQDREREQEKAAAQVGREVERGQEVHEAEQRRHESRTRPAGERGAQPADEGDEGQKTQAASPMDRPARRRP